MQYSPYNQTFPGTVLSTGTEDYFDSAWYFNGGQFWLPVSGFTHYNATNTGVSWSAYRFHEMDPLPFDQGFKFMWRYVSVVCVFVCTERATATATSSTALASSATSRTSTARSPARPPPPWSRPTPGCTLGNKQRAALTTEVRRMC